MFTGKIYKITNNFNNKIYIGQTIKSLICRLRGHYHMSQNGNTKYTKFLIDMKDKKISDYTIIEIHSIDAEEREVLNNKLNEMEAYYIKKYKEDGYDLYNILPGRRLSGDIMHLMDEKDRCEINNKRKTSLRKFFDNNPNARRGSNNSMYGKTHSDEVKYKLSELRKSQIGRNSNRSRRFLNLENNEIVYGYNELSNLLEIKISVCGNRVRSQIKEGKNVIEIYDKSGKIRMFKIIK